MPDPAHELAASRRMLLVEDVDLIQMLARNLDWRPHVVDLGAGSGTTALAVLGARPLAQITSVDIDQDAINWTEEAVYNAYPDADWIGVQARSWEAAALRSPFSEFVDLLLVDASHEREDVERDLAAWLMMVRPGGFIWMHDYLPSPPDWDQPASPGVAEAVVTFVGMGAMVTVEIRGLGWAGKRTLAGPS